VQSALDGQHTLIVAGKGTVSEGADHNSVKIALYEAQVQRGNTQTRAHLMNFLLSKREELQTGKRNHSGSS
jgi:hypothetical protein